MSHPVLEDPLCLSVEGKKRDRGGVVGVVGGVVVAVLSIFYVLMASFIIQNNYNYFIRTCLQAICIFIFEGPNTFDLASTLRLCIHSVRYSTCALFRILKN